jgi:hypothetical protein
MSREQADKTLKDEGLRTLTELENYRKNVNWVPYDEYMNHIYHHCVGREFEEWSMAEDHFDSQLQPDKLLREAAYLYGIKYRSTRDNEWIEEDQKILEEKLYTMFKEVVNCYK